MGWGGGLGSFERVSESKLQIKGFFATIATVALKTENLRQHQQLAQFLNSSFISFESREV